MLTICATLCSSSLVKLATDKKRPFRELLNATDYKLVLSARDYISDSVRAAAFVDLVLCSTG